MSGIVRSCAVYCRRSWDFRDSGARWEGGWFAGKEDGGRGELLAAAALVAAAVAIGRYDGAAIAALACREDSCRKDCDEIRLLTSRSRGGIGC